MLKVISIATILIASNATAGEIVWRSPVSGVLAPASDPKPSQPEQEPEAPALGVYYAAIRVAKGSVVNIRPVGNTTGYVFSSKDRLPVGLTLDPATGRIVGVAAVAGNYDLAIRAGKEGLSADLVLSITIP